MADERNVAGSSSSGTGWAAASAWLGPLLRVPLFAKLVGANGLIVLVALVVFWLAERTLSPESSLLILAAALMAGVVVNLLLVRVALRPLEALEVTAERVWRGDLVARVPSSPLADAHMARIGLVTNRLLDRLSADRERMRQLASKVISAQDQERSRVALELHDSVAQTLAALALELTAAARDSRDPELAERLVRVRKLVGDVLEEVRAISRSMHPRVLDDLGLPAALAHLGRQAGERTRMAVEVESNVDSTPISRVVAATLYRVAQEAMANAVRHSGGASVRLALLTTPGALRLEVEDDGSGFDVPRAEAERAGMGLFSMRERVALLDGRLQIDAAPGRGTRIVATVPL
ncbi:MAG TPA: sensor histidine kinase [Gemmatimonadaceae bacterium]|nr:sensor histidine kinase [Gemmatimonadaceae bacterium]